MSQVADKDRRYLILGFPRSGTTLLSQLLDAHPEISCPPETNLFSATGRFLSEQTDVEGPPIGVLAGLGFLGVEQDEIYAPLREMLFAMHRRVANGKVCWVEKTATDIFHVDALEPMLTGHMRFIVLLRNPLDIVASNLDLEAAMGSRLNELFEATRDSNSRFDGFAKAWVEAIERVMAFAGRQGTDCHIMRYEDLLAEPEEVLAALLTFMKMDGAPETMIADAFNQPRRIGLGDFRVHESDGIRPPKKDGWRKRLPNAAAARIVRIVGPMMERVGYPIPRLPVQPNRDDAIRQFVLASSMKRARGSEGT